MAADPGSQSHESTAGVAFTGAGYYRVISCQEPVNRRCAAPGPQKGPAASLSTNTPSSNGHQTGKRYLRSLDELRMNPRLAPVRRSSLNRTPPGPVADALRTPSQLWPDTVYAALPCSGQER